MAVGHQPIKGHRKFSLLTVLMLLLPVAAAYVGYVYVPAWWSDGDVEKVLYTWANTAYHKKEIPYLREGIRKDLKKLGVELDEADLEIRFEEPKKDYIWISYHYERELEFPFIGKTWLTHWDHEIETDLTRFQW